MRPLKSRLRKYITKTDETRKYFPVVIPYSACQTFSTGLKLFHSDYARNRLISSFDPAKLGVFLILFAGEME